VTILDITALSLRARLAIALRLFAGYCEHRGLEHPEITAYLDYLWRFIALGGSAEAFGEWEASQPALIETGLGYEYPAGFEEFLAACEVPEREFRRAVGLTTEVLYTSMYAAADEPGSRRFLGELANLAGAFGVGFPDTRHFAESRWSDGHGWGSRPSPEEVAAWRSGPDAEPDVARDRGRVTASRVLCLTGGPGW